MAVTYSTGAQAATDTNPLSATTSCNVPAGACGVCMIKHEGGARTVTSFQKDSGSPTNAFTFTNVSGQTTQVHSNGDLTMHLGYLLNASADASCTFKLTLSSAASFVRFQVLIFAPGAGETFTFDVAKIGQGTGTAISSGNATTSGDTVSMGAFGEYTGTTTSSEQINSVGATEPLSPLSDASAWYRVVSGGYTGASSATIGSSSDWLCGLIALKINAAGGGSTSDSGGSSRDLLSGRLPHLRMAPKGFKRRDRIYVPARLAA